MKCYLKTDIDGIYEYRLFTEKGLIKWVNTEIQQNDSNETSVITDLNEAIRLDASCAEAYLMRGQIYLQQKEKDLARHDLEQAASLGIPMAEIRAWLKQCK